MKLLVAFLKLIRWPNLLFIVLTQLLFTCCIIFPTFEAHQISVIISGHHWVLLCLSSVSIAAAGYAINDYFDLNIDRINKPDKLIVEKIIKRRWVIVWHLLLSATGILISFYLDWKTPSRFLGIANTGCVILLFIYSISLKKKMLAGNVLISLLTAWVILVLTFAEMPQLLLREDDGLSQKLIRLTILYAGFAFVISLIREIIKDMEDVEGDRRYGCKTMPIILGIQVSKVFTAVWLIVLIGALLIVQFYVLQFNWWLSAIYCAIFIILPLLYIFKNLFSAFTSAHYHTLSTLVKWVMFTGILSMIFFLYY